MNFAGFGLGFSQGFNNGVNIGNALNAAIKQKKIDDVREQGMEEAKAARASDVSGMIKDNGIGASPTQPTQPTAPTGTRTGEIAPDTAEVQTAPVPTPQAVVTSPQSAIDAAPAKPQGVPVAPTVAPVTPAPAAPMASTAPTPEITGATNPATAGIAPPAAPATPSRRRYSVGDASFDTIEEARGHAEKTAPSVTDYFMKNTVPKISQAYMEQGDVAKAEAWDKYAKDKASQKNMDTWAKAYRAATSGNMEKAADHVFELYKQYDDGVTPISKETVKDKAGNVTGFNVKLRDDATGEERSQFIDQRALIEMGMSALSPPAMFEQAYKRQQAADAARVKAATDAADDRRKLQADLTKLGAKAKLDADAATTKYGRDKEIQTMKGDQRVEQITIEQGIKDASIGKAEKAKVNAKVEALRDAGYDEPTIKSMLPQMLGVGEHKKTTDPTERRALVFDTLSKNDPKFARSTPEEQSAKVEQAMSVIYSTGKEAATPAPGGQPPAAAPAPAAPPSRGVPVYDTKTGKTILLDPVTRKPIQ